MKLFIAMVALSCSLSVIGMGGGSGQKNLQGLKSKAEVVKGHVDAVRRQSTAGPRQDKDIRSLPVDGPAAAPSQMGGRRELGLIPVRKCNAEKLSPDAYTRCLACRKSYKFRHGSYKRCLKQNNALASASESTLPTTFNVLLPMILILQVLGQLYNSACYSHSSTHTRHQSAQNTPYSFTHDEQENVKEAFQALLEGDEASVPQQRVTKALLTLGMEEKHVNEIAAKDKDNIKLGEFLDIMSKAMSDKGVCQKLSEVVIMNNDGKMFSVENLISLFSNAMISQGVQQVQAVEQFVRSHDETQDGGLDASEFDQLTMDCISKVEGVEPCNCEEL